MKKYLIVLSLMFVTCQTMAQRKVERAYIITADSAKVEGYIAIKTSYLYTDHILFKTSEDGAFEKYTPADIKGYVIEPGRRYERMLHNNVYRFYEYLVEGKLNLLQLEEPGQTLFFVRSDQTPLSLLYYSEKMVENRYLHRNEAYKHFLKNEMIGCDAAINRVEGIRAYEAKFLSEVVAEYNRCFDASGSFPGADKLKNPVAVYSGIIVGKAISTPSFYLGGVNMDIQGENKVVLATFFYQMGSVNKAISTGTQSPVRIQHRMTEFGVKLNVMIVSLTAVEPYVFGSFSYLRYKDLLNGEQVNKLSALSFGSGVGLKFNVSPRVFFRTEFGFHFIPGKNYLSDLTIVVDPPDGPITPTAFRGISFGLSYKIKGGA